MSRSLAATQEVECSDQASVLIVDDDQEFASLVAEYMSAEGGFVMHLRHDGASGVAAAISGHYDVIVLDVGLPALNGFDVLRRIRRQVSTPVVMLTARGDDVDRILGLEIGADDYVPKPCNLRELVARIRAVLRRSRLESSTRSDDRVQVVGDLRIEPGSQSAYLDGGIVPLTGAEFLILETLIESAGQVVDKDSISCRALGRGITPHDRSVDAHIANLRRKLGLLSSGRQRIKTVRGRGYLYVTAE